MLPSNRVSDEADCLVQFQVLDVHRIRHRRHLLSVVFLQRGTSKRICDTVQDLDRFKMWLHTPRAEPCTLGTMQNIASRAFQPLGG